MKYPINAINVLKAHGGGLQESQLLPGYGLTLQRAAQGMVKGVEQAKIACLDINLHKVKLALGISVSFGATGSAAGLRVGVSLGKVPLPGPRH